MTMRGRLEGRSPRRPAAVEPLYETERKVMTEEAFQEWSLTTDEGLRRQSVDLAHGRANVDQNR